MSQVAVIAKVTAAPGKRDQVIAVMQVGLATADGEPGTIQYVLHEDINDPDVIWFYELYANQDAFATHGGSDAMKELGKTLAPLLGARPELTMLNPLGGKGLAAGAD